jgi:hypothetical protein
MRAALLSAMALVAVGCGGERSPTAYSEPMKVRTAVFKEGALPGAPPPDGGFPSGADAGVAGPRVTLVELISGLTRAGQSGKTLGGRTTTDAVAVAVAFEGAGTGYWLQPTGFPDPTRGGELSFDMVIDFAAEAPTGNQRLVFSAIDADGVAGPQLTSALCVAGDVPDNLNACAPTLPPPAAVISLSWYGVADLDLEVTTPDGRVVNRRHPSTAGKGAGAPAVADGGVLDNDAQGGCRPQGAQRENLIFQSPPPRGAYQIRVNLFDACGAAHAPFQVQLYTREATGEKTSRLVERGSKTGSLLARQANGGSAPGLYIGDFGL